MLSPLEGVNSGQSRELSKNNKKRNHKIVTKSTSLAMAPRSRMLAALLLVLLPTLSSSSLQPSVRPARVGERVTDRVDSNSEIILEYHVPMEPGSVRFSLSFSSLLHFETPALDTKLSFN